MIGTQDLPLSVEDLKRAVEAADPRARMVPGRVIRRIANHRRIIDGFSFHLGHRSTLTVDTKVALEASDKDELHLGDGEARPDRLILIEEPDPADLLDKPPEDVLLWAWRQLFHGAIHAEIGSKLTPEDVHLRIAEVGTLVFDEARTVLDRDGRLSTPRDDVSVYEEFVASYLGITFFAPALRPTVFPVLDDPARVDAILARDIDGAAIFAQTRVEGASDPHPFRERVRDPEADHPEPKTDEAVRRSEPTFRWVIKRADRARANRNDVRSAILRTRATRLAGPSRAGQARSGAEDDLKHLERRLVAAIGEKICETTKWRPAIAELLSRTLRGIWTVEARLLYDLQNACVDFEREIDEIDLLGWLFSFGNLKLRRPLPNQTLLRMAKHLRRARNRLFKVRISGEHRVALAEMLEAALEGADQRVRERFRPLLLRGFERAGVVPRNLPERVSLKKMIEELLDRLVYRNFLTMGDIRDAISRSAIRAPDLKGFGDFWAGDRVLRANRTFSISLRGAYHSGEVYLRALQAMSQLVFATLVGRWLTLYVILPFGGAYGALVTIQEITHLALDLVPHHGKAHPFAVELIHPWSVGLLGAFFLGLIHVRRWRELTFWAVSRLGRVLKWGLIDGPLWVLRRPVIQRILRSPIFALCRRWLIEPLAVGLATTSLLSIFNLDHRWAVGLGVGAFAVTALVMNSRIGRNAEEWVIDALSRSWRWLRVDIVPGIFRLFMEVFDRFLEGVEIVIYTVDEWLRYRSGQGKVVLGFKAVLGLFWFFATYLIRIYLNLLVEPTINPLKHFPVVTIAAKMILPVLKPWTVAMKDLLQPWIGVWLAAPIATVTIIFLPGIAGFMVWEFKENWRLYESNRPKTLRPIPIGHHGETMSRLLRPGFHSGTIPKLFAKLRAAERGAFDTGSAKPCRKAREALHHVDGPIRHLIDRDLLGWLAESAPDQPVPKIAHVDLATNRVRIRFHGPEGSDGGLIVQFEERSGQLISELTERSWLDAQPESDRERWATALDGLDALAGVDSRRTVTRIESTSDLLQSLDRPSPVLWRDWVAFWDAKAGRPPAIAKPTNLEETA